MVAAIALIIYLFFVRKLGLTELTYNLEADVEALVVWLFSTLEPSQLLSSIEISLLLTIIAAFVFTAVVFARIRWRLRNSERLTNTHCPSCSFPLSRIKRKNWQRSVSKLMPFRRFYCKRCNWKGLRIKSNENIPLDTGQSYHNSRTRTRGIQHVD